MSEAASQALDPGCYARIFEGNPDGIRILDDLVRHFARNPWQKGGRAAERETMRRLCHREVIDYIVQRINQANGVELLEADDILGGEQT